MARDITTRPMRRADLEAIGRLAEDGGLFPAAMLADMASPYLDRTADDLWLVAEVNGTVACFAFAEPERFTNATWNMRAIGVAADARRGGIGAALVDAVERTLRSAGGRVVVLETTGDPDHEAARALYTSRAYEQEARLRDFWDAGVDKVIYTKAL